MALQIGYNNDLQHRGRRYHVQTEDSGVHRPQVTTHLFVEGQILKTLKTSYAEHLGRPDLSAFVKELMKEQHKAIVIALRDGEFDGAESAAKKPTHDEIMKMTLEELVFYSIAQDAS